MYVCVCVRGGFWRDGGSLTVGSKALQVLLHLIQGQPGALVHAEVLQHLAGRPGVSVLHPRTTGGDGGDGGGGGGG